MCVYDTAENDRLKYTKATLKGLEREADAGQPMVIVDNASFPETAQLLQQWTKQWSHVTLVRLEENLGTAGGLNEGIKRLEPEQHLLKIDNDVIVNTPGWIEMLEFAMEKMPEIGILGCKRKDCWENPSHPDANFRSQLVMVPHKAGEPWYFVEFAKHIMGTCVLYNRRLIDRIGGFYQFDVYGFEDSLYCTRSHAAGFRNAFLPTINIDHIDTGGTLYQEEKAKMAGKYLGRYAEHGRAILQGDSYYFDVNDKPTIG